MTKALSRITFVYKAPWDASQLVIFTVWHTQAHRRMLRCTSMIHFSHPTSTYTLYYWHTLTQTSLAHTDSQARASRGAEERMRWERACLSCVMWGLPCQLPLWEAGMCPSHRKWQWLQRGPPTLFIYKYQLTFIAAPHTQLVHECYVRGCVCFWPDRGNLQYGSWPTESNLNTQTDSSHHIPSLPVHTLQCFFFFIRSFSFAIKQAQISIPKYPLPESHWITDITHDSQ